MALSDRSFQQTFHNCDCAEFYIDTTFSSTSAGEWDADITFRFDLTTLIEDGELANIEEWFGFSWGVFLILETCILNPNCTDDPA